MTKFDFMADAYQIVHMGFSITNATRIRSDIRRHVQQVVSTVL